MTAYPQQVIKCSLGESLMGVSENKVEMTQNNCSLSFNFFLALLLRMQHSAELILVWFPDTDFGFCYPRSHHSTERYSKIIHILWNIRVVGINIEYRNMWNHNLSSSPKSPFDLVSSNEVGFFLWILTMQTNRLNICETTFTWVGKVERAQKQTRQVLLSNSGWELCKCYWSGVFTRAHF